MKLGSGPGRLCQSRAFYRLHERVRELLHKRVCLLVITKARKCHLYLFIYYFFQKQLFLFSKAVFFSRAAQVVNYH